MVRTSAFQADGRGSTPRGATKLHNIKVMTSKNKPNIGVSPIYGISCPLNIYHDDTPIGSATGFFFGNNGKIFIITNRHVVVPRKGKIPPTLIKTKLHKVENFSINDEIIIPIFDEKGYPLWQEIKEDIDIIAIPINFDKNKYTFGILRPENFLPKKIALEIGEDLLVIGYPCNYYDFEHNLPLIRNATIASAYPVPFRNSPFFLIDAALHPGTSGSAVITRPSAVQKTAGGGMKITSKTQFYLVGINSGSIDFTSIGHLPSQLNVVWYAELLNKFI